MNGIKPNTKNYDKHNLCRATWGCLVLKLLLSDYSRLI